MEKLRFKFTILGTTDGKSNVTAITSIETPDGRIFDVPNESQPVSKHTCITNSSLFAKVKNSLKKRHQERNLWIPLNEEMRKIYLDDGENIQFNDQYLEEITEEKDPATTNTENTTPRTQNLGNIAEKFLLEKFSSKTSNADQWIEEFEKECERFDILQDEKKIETLKYLLEKQSLDWYGSRLIKLTVNSNWQIWKENFCETYGKKGWSQVKYAFSFRFQAGSLLEYATKKERLLLEVNKSIDNETMINLIVMGLPEHIIDKIDRGLLESITHLYSEINKYEHLMNRKNEKVNLEYKKKIDSKLSKNKQRCTICENLNKGVRYHSEASCWFKTGVNRGENKNQIRLVNNSELECELLNEDQKNF